MTWFSQRLKLQDVYSDWCKENKVEECMMSMIVFLEVNGMINEDGVLEYLRSIDIQNAN